MKSFPGLKWESIPFSETKVSVDAVLTEPGELTQIMTIFGHVKWTEPWHIFTVNLTQLAETCGEAAYQNWTYADCDSGSDRNIGMEMSFLRRKADAACFNGEDFSRKTFNKSCEECLMTDYFCQHGYEVTEDRRCRNVDKASEAEGWIPKTNLRPIKAPGNKCITEYKWVPRNKEVQTLSRIQIKQTGDTKSVAV